MNALDRLSSPMLAFRGMARNGEVGYFPSEKEKGA